jgi:hypothetical protein
LIKKFTLVLDLFSNLNIAPGHNPVSTYNWHNDTLSIRFFTEYTAKSDLTFERRKWDASKSGRLWDASQLKVCVNRKEWLMDATDLSLFNLQNHFKRNHSHPTFIIIFIALSYWIGKTVSYTFLKKKFHIKFFSL